MTGAYNVLRTSGHLDSRRGAGSWTRLPGGVRVGQSGWWTPETAPDLIDFATAALAAPPEMAAAATDAVAALPRYLSGAGYHPTGLPELRTAVADAYTGRGVPTSPEQIMVTNGVQHALDLALRLLAPPGSTVLTESPTYPNALAASPRDETACTRTASPTAGTPICCSPPYGRRARASPTSFPSSRTRPGI